MKILVSLSRILWISAALGIIAVLAGCFDPVGGVTVDPTEALTVVLDTTSYQHGTTISFGLVDPDADPVTVSAEITNISESEVTVVSAVLAESAFSIDTPSLPAAITSGETVAVSLTFDPQESGDASSTLTVGIQGIETVFEINLEGEGNYAPRAYDAVLVSGAGDSAVNGLYVKNGTLNSDGTLGDISYYVLSGTTYRMFGESASDVTWSLGPTDDPADRLYYIIFMGPTGPTSGGSEDWQLDAGTAPVPSSAGPFDMPNDIYPQIGQPVTVNHHYMDPEGDPEGVTTFSWFISDTTDPYGTYSPVGDSTATYTPNLGEEYQYLKVEVTPIATDGTPTGEPVMIGPSPPVDPFAG